MHRAEVECCSPRVPARIYPEDRKSAFVLVERLCDVEVLQQWGRRWEQLVLRHTACFVCYTYM